MRASLARQQAERFKTTSLPNGVGVRLHLSFIRRMWEVSVEIKVWVVKFSFHDFVNKWHASYRLSYAQEKSRAFLVKARLFLDRC
jgi:hypothetical protein